MKFLILSTGTRQPAFGKWMLGLLAIYLFATNSSMVAQNFWTNPDLISGGDWQTPENWSLGTVPTASNETRIDNGGLAIINGGSAATRAFIIGNTTAGNRLEILGSNFITRGVTLGSGTGSSGYVRLATGTNWTTNGSGTFSAFVVGSAGSGTLLIESGAILHSGRTRIGIGAGTGEATVRGSWTWESNEGIGLQTANAILNLGSGGKVSLVGDTKIVTLAGTLNVGGKITAETAGRLNAESVNGAGGAATLNFNHTDTNYIFETETNTAIAITGTTNVHQIAGVTTLTAANTYTGTTSVTGGTLLVNGSLSASSDVTVSSAGTLGGTGSAGDIVVEGTLAPGNNGVGGFSADNISLMSGATLSIELGLQAGTPVSNHVQIEETFSLASGTNLQLALGSGLNAPSGGDIFFLVRNDGDDAIGGVFEQLNGIATDLNEGSFFSWNAQQYQITYLADFGSGVFTGGNDIALQVIPEPVSILLFGVGMMPLCFHRRR